jgi:hypothetical protein
LLAGEGDLVVESYLFDGALGLGGPHLRTLACAWPPLPPCGLGEGVSEASEPLALFGVSETIISPPLAPRPDLRAISPPSPSPKSRVRAGRGRGGRG